MNLEQLDEYLAVRCTAPEEEPPPWHWLTTPSGWLHRILSFVNVDTEFWHSRAVPELRERWATGRKIKRHGGGRPKAAGTAMGVKVAMKHAKPAGRPVHLLKPGEVPPRHRAAPRRIYRKRRLTGILRSCGRADDAYSWKGDGASASSG